MEVFCKVCGEMRTATFHPGEDADSRTPFYDLACDRCGFVLTTVDQQDDALPRRIYEPRLLRDGDQWLALFGEDLHSGVSGFGATQEEALDAFDRSWETQKSRLSVAT